MCKITRPLDYYVTFCHWVYVVLKLLPAKALLTKMSFELTQLAKHDKVITSRTQGMQAAMQVNHEEKAGTGNGHGNVVRVRENTDGTCPQNLLLLRFPLSLQAVMQCILVVKIDLLYANKWCPVRLNAAANSKYDKN